MTPGADSKGPARSTLVGTSARRKQDPRLLTGGGRFIDDLEFDGIAHAAVVRSPEAHGRLVRFDASAALEHPEVIDVLTPEQIAAETEPMPCLHVIPGQHRDSYPVAPTDVVRFVGEPLGLVVASSRAAAEDAVDLIEIEIEPLEPVPSTEIALAQGAPLLFPEWETNVAVELLSGDPKDDVEAAIAAAPHVIERTYTVQRQTGTPIEARGSIARWDPVTNELTLWNSSQAPHSAREQISRVLKFPIERIRVIAPDLGGGFGTKGSFYVDELMVALAARRTGKPVKWIQDRREALLGDMAEREQKMTIRLACDEDGRFLALDAEGVADIGAYPGETSPGPPAVTLMSIQGSYRIPLLAAHTQVVVTNKAPLGAMRGFGMPSAFWPLERVVDEAARELGIEPDEIRRRNMIAADEFPYQTRGGVSYDSGDYVNALERALSLVSDVPKPDDGRRRGIGIASFVEPTSTGPTWLMQLINFQISGFESATMRLETDGTLTVASGVIAMGQGIETALGQIAADSLGMPMESVNVVLGDTAITPHSGFGSQASRSTAIGGSAVFRAGEKLRSKVLELAAHRLEAAPEDIEFDGGGVSVKGVPGSSVSFAELAKQASLGWGLPEGMEPELATRDLFDIPSLVFGYATNVVAVAVDLETGEVEIERFVSVHDCGKIINPMIVEGQQHGALATGLAMTFYESLEYDEQGQPRSTTFMDYLLPTSHEVPDFVLDHTEVHSPLTPTGVKGVGEGGTLGVAPAIGNAIAAAVPEVAHLVNDLPLSPARLWKLFQEADLTA